MRSFFSGYGAQFLEEIVFWTSITFKIVPLMGELLLVVTMRKKKNMALGHLQFCKWYLPKLKDHWGKNKRERWRELWLFISIGNAYLRQEAKKKKKK